MDNRLIHLKEKVSRVSNYLIIAFILFLALSLVRNWNRIQSAQERIDEKGEKVQKIAQDNEDLKVKIDEIESAAYIEKQIRDNLGLAREGEIIIVLPDDEVLRSLAPSDFEEEEELPEPNWVKWKKLFF